MNNRKKTDQRDTGDYTFYKEIDDQLKRNISDFVIARTDPEKNIPAESLPGAIGNLLDGLKRWSIYSSAQHEYFYAFNRSMLFINENLSKKLTLKEISKVAGISGYHFHRLFTGLFRETPAQFIRRLRLERAMFYLLMTAKSLNEITDDTGYGNRSALTKSFKKKYGLNPGVARKNALLASSLLAPCEYMRAEPVIKEVDTFSLLYTRIIHGCCSNSTFLETWQSILAFTGADGRPHADIHYFGGGNDCPLITPREKMRVFAGISGMEKIKPFSIFRFTEIPGGLFAVFPFKGNYAEIKKLYTYIHQKWIYETGYEIRDMVFFEKYRHAPSAANLIHMELEIYIPVKRKPVHTVKNHSHGNQIFGKYGL